jgi:hypothetical protein
VAVSTIEDAFGLALLLLIGLVVLLSIVMVLLAEAHYIVSLSNRLLRRIRSNELDPPGSSSPATESRHTKSLRDEQEAQ